MYLALNTCTFVDFSHDPPLVVRRDSRARHAAVLRFLTRKCLNVHDLCLHMVGFGHHIIVVNVDFST